MASPIQLPRALLIYAITIPFALVLGYILTSPTDFSSFAVLLGTVFTLAVPLLLRWHHAVLIFSWNAYLSLNFLPGRPYLWMAAAGLSFGFAALSKIMDRETRLQHVPELTWSLLSVLLVVVVTAKLTGGIRLGTFGGGGMAGGGKHYFHVFAAILGYFALSLTPIPREKAHSRVSLYLLSGVTTIGPHLILLAGPVLYWLFMFFPTEYAYGQLASEVRDTGIVRIGGLGIVSASLVGYLQARYGVLEMLALNRPHRLLFLLLSLGAGLMGGFRSVFGTIVLCLAIQFFVQGLHRTWVAPVLLGFGLLGMAALVPLAPHLPLSAQRTLSFLPFLDVDPIARIDAQGSSEWRMNMWKHLTPDLDRYVFVGKGYNIDMTDLFFAQMTAGRGFTSPYEASMISGDYHNGPLSLYIPFASFGVLAFSLFLFFSTRALYRNFRYGDPELKHINAFLLSYFITQIVGFCFIFGAFSSQLFVFTGTIGLSVALNHGVKKASTGPEPA